MQQWRSPCVPQGNRWLSSTAHNAISVPTLHPIHANHVGSRACALRDVHAALAIGPPHGCTKGALLSRLSEMFSHRCRTALPRRFALGTPFVSIPRCFPIRHLRTRGAEEGPPQTSRTVPQHSNPSPVPNQSTTAQHNTQYSQENPNEPELPDVKIKFLTPAIWALAVSSGVYVSLAYFTAKNELENTGPYRLFQGNGTHVNHPTSPYISRGPPTPTELATQAWRQMDPMSKLSWSIIGFSGVVHLSSTVAQGAWQRLWHIPATNRNYTLLTSTFVHGGLMHLGINMYALYNFLPVTGYSSTFRGDTNHMLSFFVATGLVSGLAQHIAGTIFTRGRPYSPFIPSGGASGALFAVLGTFCMQYPNAGLGVILIPYHVEAQYFLPAIMLFDLVGMVRGFSFVNLGHAVCLLPSRPKTLN